MSEKGGHRHIILIFVFIFLAQYGKGQIIIKGKAEKIAEIYPMGYFEI